MSEASSLFPSWINYLCIEGVIGAGKTTFCQMLARDHEARTVLEMAEENPFLDKFYKDRKAYAFQTQLWFLVSRYKQLSEAVGQQDLFYSMTVSDYIFAKDRIFAGVNLTDEEMRLYEQVAAVMADKLTRPDLVVYFQASTDVLLRRIEKRGRTFEYNMDPRYIATLNEAYNHFFFHYNDTPLLIVNTSELDFVNNPADFSEIIAQIAQAGKGSNYYQPMAAKDKSRLHETVLASRSDAPATDDTAIEALQEPT